MTLNRTTTTRSNAPASLAARLKLPTIIPAAVLDLPPHRGRKSSHDLLKSPCDTHRFDRIPMPGIVHPLSGKESAPYCLLRAVPKTPAPRGGWPVLYMLDGNAAFDFLTAQHLAGLPQLVIIGVGHTTEGQFDRQARMRDFTLPADRQAGATADQHGILGGAPEFLGFLTGPLRERAEADLAIDPDRRTLWGHSFGGLFTLHVLLGQGGGFTRFAAISPSLWWNPGGLSDAVEAALAAWKMPTPVPLYLGSGNREKRTGSTGPMPTEPPATFLELAARFAESGRFDLMTQIYDEAVHIASLPSSLPATLRFAALQSPGNKDYPIK